MNNIEKDSVKYLIVLIIAVALCGMLLYPIFDLVYFKLITKTEFAYSVNSYIIQPILFGCIFGTTFWLINKQEK